MKKAQVTIEFIVIFGIVFLFSAVFVYTVIERMSISRDEQRIEYLKDVALIIKHEILIAHKAEDGYSRAFDIPKNVLGKNYAVSVDKNLLTVKSGKYSYSVRVGNFTGSINITHNVVRKVGGVVYLNT